MARRSSKVVDPAETPMAWFPDEGCFRLVDHTVETVTIGGTEQSFDVQTVGEKVIWVDDAPDAIEDGSGHFEVFTGDDEDYTASVPNTDETEG